MTDIDTRLAASLARVRAELSPEMAAIAVSLVDMDALARTSAHGAVEIDRRQAADLEDETLDFVVRHEIWHAHFATLPTPEIMTLARA